MRDSPSQDLSEDVLVVIMGPRNTTHRPPPNSVTLLFPNVSPTPPQDDDDTQHAHSGGAGPGPGATINTSGGGTREPEKCHKQYN